MKRALCISLLFALLLSGCGAAQSQEETAETQTAETAEATETAAPAALQSEAVSRTLFAMDTVMDLTVYGDESLLDEAEETITALESALSVTDESSEIYAINQNGSGTLSEQPAALLQSALELCARTDGALDITIYPVVRAWGFTTDEYRVPEDSELEELLQYVDYTQVQFDSESSTVTLQEGAELDLGSVTKGYTGDLVTTLWRDAGVTSGLLNLGGNVQAVGAKPDGSPWRVAIQDPNNSESYLGVVEIEDQAVITSGGYERYFEQDGVTYWHIISPETGKPAHSGLISVTIVGDQGVTCDALSTSLFVMGLDKASELWRASDDFEAIFCTEEGQLYITEGLADSFTPMGDYEDAEVEVITRD